MREQRYVSGGKAMFEILFRLPWLTSKVFLSCLHVHLYRGERLPSAGPQQCPDGRKERGEEVWRAEGERADGEGRHGEEGQDS